MIIVKGGNICKNWLVKHTAVIGAQWGDEGKGKIVDFLASKHDVVVRFQGGNNAGHTVVVEGEKYPLHLLPSGILYQDKICVIGDGVAVNPAVLVEELASLKKRVGKTAKVHLSSKAQVIMPWHVVRDGIEGERVGTTGRGIGPVYADATGRTGIRVMDLLNAKVGREKVAERAKWNKRLIETLLKHHGVRAGKKLTEEIGAAVDAKRVWEEYKKLLAKLKKLGVVVGDTGELLAARQAAGGRILFEGAQATLLDVTHGDYPFVTSSHPSLGGVYMGAGIRPKDLHVVGVAKAYATRVGNGPFPTELTNRIGDKLREVGHEFGTTTGRPRRCGWLDLVALKYAARVNGFDSLAITKLDVLSGLTEVRVAVGYTHSGKRISSYPADERVREKVRPMYKTFTGWRKDVSGARKMADLPMAARRYLEFVEKSLGVPIAMVGVGPGREELVRA